MSSMLQRSATARALPRLGDRAIRAAQAARLTVVPRLRRRAPRVPFLVLVSLLLVAGVVGLLLFNTSMQQAAFTAAQLEDQAENLQAREEALAMQIDDLRDPQRVAEMACSQGMVLGPVAAFVDVGTGKVSGTPTSAVPAPCGISAPRPTKPTAAKPTRSTGSTGTNANTNADAGTTGRSGVVSADRFAVGR